MIKKQTDPHYWKNNNSMKKHGNENMIPEKRERKKNRCQNMKTENTIPEREHSMPENEN